MPKVRSHEASVAPLTPVDRPRCHPRVGVGRRAIVAGAVLFLAWNAVGPQTAAAQVRAAPRGEAAVHDLRSDSAHGDPTMHAPVPEKLWTDAPKTRDRSSDPLRLDTFARLAEAASPSVVNIDVTVAANPRLGAGGEAVGQGSGFIIHRDGYVVTNAHVVGHAASIRVTTSDRNVYPARVVGMDEATDIALLQIVTTERTKPARGFPIAVLGDSSSAKPGEWVVAIGNPFGLNHSVTAGIVSAVGRRDISPDSRLKYVDFIQFDAAINFGNSGGPLLDVNGHVIGVNTALRTGNDIGFAVPIEMVRTLLPHLGKGRVERGWIGIQSASLSADAARARGVERRGARVTEVQKGSPADVAGLNVDDIILVFDGQPIEDAPKLRWFVASTPPNKRVAMSVRRENQTIELWATLQSMPRDPALADAAPPSTPTGPVSQGISVDTLDDDARKRLDLGTLPGVLVTYVDTAAVAYLAGLRVGDVVTHVNNEATSTAAAFRDAVAKVRAGQQLQLRVRRGRVQVFLSFTAGATQ